MRHVNRHQARRFRAKSAGSQRYALVAILQGKTDLIDGEIAFRPYQYRNISRGCIVAFSTIRE